jgi:hypothetical protein
MQRLAADARIFSVSSVRGEGMDELADWLAEQHAGMMAPK